MGSVVKSRYLEKKMSVNVQLLRTIDKLERRVISLEVEVRKLKEATAEPYRRPGRPKRVQTVANEQQIV